MSEHPNDPAAWRPSGVVALLTDFGLADAYVGVMKGVVLGRAPQARLVDLSHGVAPQAVLQAAWYLRGAVEYFPPGTVHVAVVDPGVGSARRILVALDRGQAFLAPDNGLLGPVLSPAAEVRALDAARFALPRVSRTFHGRDVFAPAAAALAAGLDPRAAGPPAGAWLQAALPAPAREADGWRTEVLYADRYGNLVTPLEAAALEGAAGWTARLGAHELPLVGTYADVAPGAPLALFGSSGTLELSVRDGDAARALGAGPGAPVLLRRSPR